MFFQFTAGVGKYGVVPSLDSLQLYRIALRSSVMDSCQEVGIDTCPMSYLLKIALLTLFSPISSFAMQAKQCLQRHKHFKLKEDYLKIKCDDSFLLHIYIYIYIKRIHEKKKIQKEQSIA